MYTYKIVRDLDAEDPRKNYSHMGTMVCWHREYKLGDQQPKVSPEDYIEAVWGSKKRFEREAFHLPLYLYDHSGITMATTPFSCPWDSGQVGFIWVSKSRVREEYDVSRITKALENRVHSILTAEVGDYDQWLRGEVCGWEVYDEAGDVVDSCWGYYDLELAKEEALAVVDSLTKEKLP